MCAPHCPTPSPTPSAAPSASQSPGTVPGAPTGRTAPAGPIYLTSAGNIAYTYADGDFLMYWFHQPHQPQWKPSALLAERYARESRGPEMRSPAQWLAEYAAGHDFKEITQKEFDTMCETGIAPSGDAAATTGGTAALEPQQTEIQTTTADADGESGRLCPVDASAPVTGGPMTQDLAGAATGQAMPSFDFSPLGALAEQAADADQQFDLHYGTAQDEYLVSCIYLARIHALTAKAGRYGGGTWTKWYESKGLSEGSARTMVKNGDAFNSATVAELKQLPNLTRKDLNLIARSGCADQVVAAAGDSHRVQALLAQLKAERERADNAEERAQGAERQLEAAQADVAAVLERAQAAQRSAELDAKELQRLDKLTTHYKAENDRRAADQQRLEGLNATLVQEMAEKTARIQELEARPVEVTGATEKEIARWKAEGAKAERDKAQKERDKAAVREAALRKELSDLRVDNEQVSTEMLALQSELCELRRQTDQGQGDPADPTRYAAAACRAILLPELERIAQLPNGAYRDAMEVLYELSDALGYACANGGSWPQEATEPDTPMEDAPEDAEEDPGFEEWPGWMHQKWAEEHPEEGDPA